MLPIPQPNVPISVRGANEHDLPFIDAQQKLHSKQLGFLQHAALRGKLEKNEIIIAEGGGGRIGYCIGSDRYFKRDEVGNIAQLCVVEGHRRGLVGAALLRAMFARWPRGTRLACLWCAQDLEGPGRFWEAMGFVPVAYRQGSRTKGKNGTPRVHIFWQCRTVEGDVGVGATPWWYPCLTGSGQIREDRVVLPIPEGEDWRAVRPRVLAGEVGEVGEEAEVVEYEDVEPGEGEARVFADGVTEDEAGRLWKDGKRLATAAMLRAEAGVGPGGMFFVPEGATLVAELPKPKPKRRRRKRKAAAKAHDPALLSFARDLRDAWLEHVNAGGRLLPGSQKYAATRELPALTRETLALPGGGGVKMLPAA